MAQTPGWFPDPFGRFQHRYHDGEAWSANVANDAVQQTDPMGTSTVVPFVLPHAAIVHSSPWPPPKPADRRG